MTQLALNLEPKPSAGFEAFDEVIQEAGRAMSALLVPASLFPPACAAAPVADRCRAKPKHDRIYVVPGERGDCLRLGKKVGEVTVLCHDWVSPPAYDFFRSLKKRHYDLYSQLVKLLAESRGAL